MLVAISAAASFGESVNEFEILAMFIISLYVVN